MTKRRAAGLSVWHLVMMALGTVIGGSFFLGSAIAIKTAGPGILAAFVLGGLLVYIILSALSEMTVAQPAAGSFRTHAEQIYGPAAGFITGWVYWAGLTLAMSSEATAAALFLRSWIPGVSVPMMAIIIVLTVTMLNLVGAKTLSNLESGLAFIKLFAIVAFIILGLSVISGIWPGKTPVLLGALGTEPLLPTGLSGIAGSMLIVMFAYAGFEVIGLAAAEVSNPDRTVPRAIAATIISLVALYCLTVVVLLPLVPTGRLSLTTSPLVAGLTSVGLGWVGRSINGVLVTSILSTMLASMFGMGRMIRSLAHDGYAPAWLKEEREVPVRGIMFSGIGMLGGVLLSYVLPKYIYLFLVSAGGFSLLFTYAIIMATHYKFRKMHGCPEKGHCQLWGYPYTTLFGLVALIGILASMPLVPGQGSGLVAGLALVAFFSLVYMITGVKSAQNPAILMPLVDMEASEEVAPRSTVKSNQGQPEKD